MRKTLLAALVLSASVLTVPAFAQVAGGVATKADASVNAGAAVQDATKVADGATKTADQAVTKTGEAVHKAGHKAKHAGHKAAKATASPVVNAPSTPR